MGSYVVGYSTQIGPFPNPSQGSQKSPTFYMVYHDKMNQCHADLMKDAQNELLKSANIGIISTKELYDLPKTTGIIFVIPNVSDKLISQIRGHALFQKPIIYTAKCVVESLKFRRIKLPSRSLGISTSMFGCHVFVTKSCNSKEFQHRIFEMSGEVVSEFNHHKLNVVVASRADDKYCSKARLRDVTVVSKDWVNENYDISRSEENHLNHDALSQLSTYQIKPFLGLTFKITKLSKELKDLISNNGGTLAFGQNEAITHIVSSTSLIDGDSSDRASKGPKVVDIEFLKACDSEGYYMTEEEYKRYKKTMLIVKQEPLSQAPMTQSNGVLQSQNCFTPPQQNPRSTLSSIRSNGCDRLNENQSMPPPQPSSIARSSAYQPQNSMRSFIDHALTSLDTSTQLTQAPSTQIRGLPEPAIRFERTIESSQQLYWSDSVSKRR